VTGRGIPDARSGPMGRVKRLVLPALLLVAVYFAVFGGEYSLFELRATRQAVEREETRLLVLQGQIDSLEARRDSLASDSSMLERVARERFGMIRPGETLYRFTEPQSAAGPDSTGGGGSR